MNLTTKFSEGCLELFFSGELDHHAAKEAMIEIGREIDFNLPRECVINFKNLTFMDSSGIAVVLNCHKRMKEIDGQARIVNVPNQPMKVLSAAGVFRIVEIAGTK